MKQALGRENKHGGSYMPGIISDALGFQEKISRKVGSG